MSSSFATPSTAALAPSKRQRVILIAATAVMLPYVPRNTEEATEWYITRVRSNVIRPTRSVEAANAGGGAAAECGDGSITFAAAAEGGTPIWVVVILCICSFPAVFWIVFYTLPQLYMTFRSVPNLKEKYGAKWSLVTGGGSGIGKALVFKLARQGLNVVVVSLDDDILKATIKQLKEQFPDLQFRSIGVSFSPGVEYMKKIRESTDDIEIPIIFNNAGFLVTGFFDQAPIGKLLANMECTYIYVCYYLFIWMFVIYLL